MSIQRAEELKQEWTDKHVVVRRGVPELHRFDGLVGQVRTVNMNCRLLVEFDAAADISWYDIDRQFVTVVESVQTQPSSGQTIDSAKPAEGAAAAVSVKSSSEPAAAASTGMSPLDQIRKQAAGSATADRPAENIPRKVPAEISTASAPAGSPEKSKTVSPLDQIRQQAAGKKTAAATGDAKSDSTVQRENASDSSLPVAEPLPTSAPAAVMETVDVSPVASPAVSATVAVSSVPTSTADNPLDQIRAQAAADSDSHATVATSGTPTILDQIRAQAEEDELNSV
ncbi:MAG: hypothetical protein P8J37_17165 [Fuerstiella sp.]|nr:hypothetical protein [Fuerstiella sp.]